MWRTTSLIAVLALGATGVACGGDGGGLPAQGRFCELLEQAESSDVVDVSDEAAAGEALEILADLRDAAPGSVADDLDVIIEGLEALTSGDLDRLADEDFIRDVEDASADLERYARDECGIDIGGDATDDATDDTAATADTADTSAADDTGEPVPVDAAVPLAVTAQGVAFFPSYDEPQGTWAAVVTNPDDALVAEYVTVQATFRDAGGAVVGTDTGYLSEIGPGERRAVATDYADLPETAVTVEVVTSVDSYRTADAPGPGLSFGPSTVRRDDDGRLTILGEITNSTDTTIGGPTVTAVFRSPDGTVVGGTQGYPSFVPAQGSVGVELSTSLVLPVDTTVELFADWSSSGSGDDAEATPVTVTDQGFSTSGDASSSSGTWGALVTNPNGDLTASYVQVIATFRDATGTVVGVESSSIGAIPAGGTGAFGSDYLYDLPPSASTMDVVAWTGSWNDAPVVGALTVSGVTVEPQDYGGVEVIGELTSTFAGAGDGVGVVAVFRDADGVLVGAGTGYVDIVPAGGSTGFSIISVFTYPGPVSAEVYPDPGNLLDG